MPRGDNGGEVIECERCGSSFEWFVIYSPKTDDKYRMLCPYCGMPVAVIVREES